MRDVQSFLASLPAGPTVLLQYSQPGLEPRWLLFRDPIAILAADSLAEVAGVLAEVDAAIEAGCWVAGFLAYEASPAMDPALETFASKGTLPLVWWGIFKAPREVDLTLRGCAAGAPLEWRPAVSTERYMEALRRIRDHIGAGDTYQVNYTFPLLARFPGQPSALFAALAAGQRSRYCAYVETDRFAICSASPELFFSLTGERILTRPMKGTARRGRYPEEDEWLAAELRASEKDRAENLMIVDMMRNDLGKIAQAGSVRADELFTVETYPTVHQLTSTVSARTRAPVSELLRALFPSASITGAPKVSTSKLIRELEAGPRGVYTGSIGCFGPGRRGQLNVAIRTATIDRLAGIASFGTGGGIVWDSDAEAELEECRTKALVLRPQAPEFDLLETLLWRPRSGYALLERHLDRLASSARYFDFPWHREHVLEQLEQAVATCEPVRHRVRLTVSREAEVTVDAQPWPCSGRTVWTVSLDDRPIEASDPLLFHKTTARHVYDEASRRHPDYDEVILWNAGGELTESTRANLVLEVAGECLTPPVRCGLLAGTYRAELLARGRIREQVLPIAALSSADKVFLINSVRGWIRVAGRIGGRPEVTGVGTGRPRAAV